MTKNEFYVFKPGYVDHVCSNRLIWGDEPRGRVRKSPPARFSFRKVGGLYHWRVGRLGGSFYVAKSRVPDALDSPAAHMVTRFSPLPVKPASEPRSPLSVNAELAIWCANGLVAMSAGFLTVALLFAW
jgi:hypothetical protein